MVYLIGQDLKAAFKKKYTYIYLAGVVAVAILANLSMIVFRDAIYGTSDGSFSYNLIIFAEGFFWVPYYSCIFIADIIFGKNYPFPSELAKEYGGHFREAGGLLKRPISSPERPGGLTRGKIYFSKLIAALILLCIFAAFAIIVFLTLTPLLQTHDGTIDSFVISDFMDAVWIALPLFCAGISISMMCLFSTTSKRKAFLIFIILVILLPRLILLLAMDGIHFVPCVFLTDYLITPQFQTLQFFVTRDLTKAILSGVIYMVISSAIGLYIYKRK